MITMVDAFGAGAGWLSAHQGLVVSLKRNREVLINRRSTIDRWLLYSRPA
jgi:hypothetical protein